MQRVFSTLNSPVAQTNVLPLDRVEQQEKVRDNIIFFVIRFLTPTLVVTTLMIDLSNLLVVR